MKKRIIFFILLFTIISTGSITVWADMGPKESLYIEITGIEGDYYVGLLSAFGVGGGEFATDSKLCSEKLKVLNQYQDKDGYSCLSKYWTVEGETRCEWSYRPPKEFKILIYDVEKECYYVSEKCELYSLDSSFYVDIEDGEITVKKGLLLVSLRTLVRIIEFIIRLLITLSIEVKIAKEALYKSKEGLQIITRTNIVTQILLNIILFVLPIFYVMFLYIPLEIIVFLVEAIIYVFTLYKYDENYINGKDKKWICKLRVFKYAFVANATSFILGAIIHFIGYLFDVMLTDGLRGVAQVLWYL